jgi:hypothetical protein
LIRLSLVREAVGGCSDLEGPAKSADDGIARKLDVFPFVEN